MGQNVLDTDSFGGTNGNTLSTYNAKWTSASPVGANEVTIQGTPGVGSAGRGDDYNTAATWTNDQWAELIVDGTTLASQEFFVCVRVAKSGGNTMNGYGAGCWPGAFDNHYRIVRSDGDSLTSLASAGTNLATGDTVNFQVVGTVLTMVVNGGTPLTYDTSGDATKYSTGSPGMRLQHGSGVRLAGSWRAGSVTGASASGLRRNSSLNGLGASGPFFHDPLAMQGQFAYSKRSRIFIPAHIVRGELLERVA